MPRMHPTRPHSDANRSERKLFTAFESIQDRDDWVVLTGLTVGQHVAGLSGEVDAIVIAPGKGILLIEVKTAEHVEYRDGQWFLAKNPNPTKSPLVQLDGARRSIRYFLKNRELLSGDEPIARLVWFANLGRWQFDNGSPQDLTFFEWELAWGEDLAKPAETVERVLGEYVSWYGATEGLEIEPKSLTAAHASEIADALLSSFTATTTPGSLRAARLIDERALLEQQEIALELLETNPHLYFDGPAGCGKSWLVVIAARRAARAGHRTLLTCWNLLMADELRDLLGSTSLDIEVADLNSIMLRVCGLDKNPEGADDTWYREELPTRALVALAQHPERGAFAAICVDEFQDIAGVPVIMEVLKALAADADIHRAQVVLAGDAGQQIMRSTDDRAEPLVAARELVPDLVHVRVRRNCRVAPRLLRAISSQLGRPLDHSGDRMSEGTFGRLDSVTVAEGRELPALVTVLKGLLEQHQADEIVVLSPFGAQSSLVGRLLAREPETKEERWLHEHLGEESGIAWHSIFKFKGLDAAAVVLTDLSPESAAWADDRGLSWNDLLYVGMTRAQYRCTLLRAVDTPWRGEREPQVSALRARQGIRVLGGPASGAAAAMSKMAGR
ncbi:NERD domain-containing protein [Salinibacterium sp. NG253]|uniref:nuclease-related domain-containing DEAD/DEAH box helicase n=1 Tax=Salinibacterium sp. NG253 TaxID=2792039 RepID=UPI0018CDCCBF|nr:NERD domain-containing protein [Salinibacterium sp. NG253]MBH0116047.1 NERD domain-containing protein [Salinibacterium sp. NG253]